MARRCRRRRRNTSPGCAWAGPIIIAMRRITAQAGQFRIGARHSSRPAISAGESMDLTALIADRTARIITIRATGPAVFRGLIAAGPIMANLAVTGQIMAVQIMAAQIMAVRAVMAARMIK
jgi:hypothetical protein